MAKRDITVDRLRYLLSYEPETGHLTWLVARGKIPPGTRAGGLNDQGYILLRVDSVAVRAHRIAWALMTGEMPTLQIDHINRVRSDNRWINLRQATHSQNHQNLVVRKDCRHGIRGIEKHSSGLWRARLSINKKRVILGYFKTAEEATQARIDGEKKYFTHSSACSPQSACHDDHAQQGDTQSEDA